MAGSNHTVAVGRPFPPESIQLLYREMVSLGGGIYIGFCRASEGHPDLIVFEDPNHHCMMALPAISITADGVRSAIRKLGER